MLQYIARRLVLAIPTLFGISVVSFIVMHLAPGDFMSSMAAQLAAQGEGISGEQLEALRKAYGLDQPVYVQYLVWIEGILLRGDFGLSLEWRVPVAELIWQRIGTTVAFTGATILISWLIAIPIGVYSATHRYSILDYLTTGVSFFFLGVPGFTLALVALWVSFSYFNADIAGIFSDAYRDAPWSLDKVLDLLRHAWIPVLILASENWARIARIMRANLLDELPKPYVTSARAGGVAETKLVWEYPTRVAVNPLVSDLGFQFADLISTGTIIGIVMALPFTGPLLFNSLVSKDTYVAGAMILLLGSLVVVGTMISDVALAWVDPRIRYDRR
jgi:peptide/nickel transport system permease protein